MSDSYAGLIGTVVGAIITGGFAWFTDWRKNRSKNKKDLEVLSLKLTYKLERYVALCLECSEDDGCEYYHEDEGRCSGSLFRGYNIEFPEFNLGKFEDIDWKLLPVKLMHEIFTLPTKVNNARPPRYHFIFDKTDVCIKPSLMKAQYRFVLLQNFFFQKFTHQISNLHII